MYRSFMLAAAISFLPASREFFNNEQHADNDPGIVGHLLSSIRTAEHPLTGKQQHTAVWSDAWLAEAQNNIRRSEYHIRWQDDRHAYSSPNRKHNLRFYYRNNGFSAEPRTRYASGESDLFSVPGDEDKKIIPGWKVDVELNEHQVGKGVWKNEDNRAEYQAANMTVQYINNEDGMRQNFIVNKPLQNKETLQIDLHIRTKLKISVPGNHALHFSRNNKTLLQYDNLKVWDANGKILDASIIQKGKKDFAISVNTHDAVYPITVDPLSSTPSTFLDCSNTNALFGNAAAAAGDVNGDGYGDVVVGAYFYNNGHHSEGAFFVYHGSATGLNPAPAIIVESNQVGWQMGYSVSTAGDVNGDGYSDIAVGVVFYSNGQTNEGAIFIYNGSPSGISGTPSAVAESNMTGTCRLGFSVACAGDVNNDGYSDVVAGANGYSSGESNEGAMYLFMGSAGGMLTTPAVIYESNQVNAQLGWSVSCAGDINGDGYSDIVTGSIRYTNGETSEGAAYIFYGSASGIAATPNLSIEGNIANINFGTSVAGIGDVNGDGYSDVAVGAPSYSNGQSMEGLVRVYHGSAAGLNTTPALSIEGNAANAYIGYYTSSSLGDVNGDGYSDMGIVINGYTNPETNEGAVSVYAGSATGLNTTPIMTFETNQAFANMTIITSAGDVNGDGYSDVLAGANQYETGQTDEGGVWIFHGGTNGISIAANTSKEYSQANAHYGISVASAGDVNADGYADVIIGASAFDGGQADEGAAFIFHGLPGGITGIYSVMLESNQANALMGYCVSTAGDINADGYSDIIVGAPNYASGQSFEGVAFIYHGTLGGIDPILDATLEIDQGGANLGISVSHAGDVNRDGYSDVIVGSFRYSNGQSFEGASVVWYGAAAGINPAIRTILESNIASAEMGIAVGSAGDVNGDGFSDVAAGTIAYSNGQANEGAMYIYLGAASGILTTPSQLIESNMASAGMGSSVTTAGDVNGDGYSDVLAGAPGYNSGLGAVLVYYGSSAGLNTTPVIIASNQSGSMFGYKAASAGDVNGDGYSDVVVGAYQYNNGLAAEGAVFVFLGGATGISTTHDSFWSSGQAGASLGYAVSTAGDLNGDGYSDIITGAYEYDNPESNEGLIFIHLGNRSGNNKRHNLLLYNSTLSSRLSNANFNLANFGAGLFARSFLGRDKGKMVWETRLNYTAYSGTPITNSTAFTAQQAGYTDLGVNGFELKTLINKIAGAGTLTRLRARIKFSPAKAFTGQLYGPWRYVSDIIDGNRMGVLPIELKDFRASWLQKGRTARIVFSTAKEEGICCFDVEKSSDGFSFSSMARLSATNGNSGRTYSVTDPQATASQQFYRLKITGMQGQVTYSSIQQLQYHEAADILVFPNPAADKISIGINGNSPVDLQLINSAGQTIRALKQVKPAGGYIDLPLSGIPAGHYRIRLYSGNTSQLVQFIKN